MDNSILKYYIFALLFFYFGTYTLFAQEQVQVTYLHFNLAIKHVDIKEDYILYANELKSSFKKSHKEKQENKIFEEDSNNFFVYTPDKYKREFYTDFKTGKIKQLSSYENETTVANDKPPKLIWEISSETKEIGGYTVIMAETSFRGRDYEAWFAPSIPIPAGPWKLNGLPGLILEAADKDRDYSWHAVSIKELESEKELEIQDKNYTELSLKEALSLSIKEAEMEANIKSARQDSESMKILGFQTKTMSSKVEYARKEALERTFEWEED